MRRMDKEKLYWMIVWLILVIVFVCLVQSAILKVFSLDVGSLKTFPTEHISVSFPVLPEKRRIPYEERTSMFEDDFEVSDPLYGEELYRFYIAQICEQHYPEVDPYIALAVLEIESNYIPNLRSSAGAVGLMQWIPKWHSWRMDKFHLNDVWDPYTNIIVGIDLLNDLYESSGNWSSSLFGYNHSSYYVNLVLSRADKLRGCGYFG